MLNFSKEELASVFGASACRADPLFGEESVSCNEAFFLPFWEETERRVLRDITDLYGFYAPGAFAPFRKNFLQLCVQLWSGLCSSAAEEAAGKPEQPGWFTQKMMPAIRNGRLFGVMAGKYPVFASQIAMLTAQTAENLTGIARALFVNDGRLRAEFRRGAERCRVQCVTDGISDRHNGGKSVHVVSYENGDRIVMKPHSMELDRAFQSYLADLCRLAGTEPWERTHSVEIGEYSYCTFIASRDLRQPEEAETFYFREGFLQAAVWLLGGNDMHSENVAACGAAPVVVDTETIFRVTTPYDCLFPPADHSLSSMAFLPYLVSGPGLNPGIDTMTSCKPDSHNFPVWQGTSYRGSDYTEAVVRGFALVMDTCGKHGDEVCSMIRRHFSGCESRRLLRATKVYAVAMQALAGRKAVSSPEQYELASGFLSTHLLREGHEEQAKRLVELEKSALRALDIPIFTQRISENDLLLAESNVRSVSEEQTGRMVEEIRFLLQPTHADDTGKIPGGHVLPADGGAGEEIRRLVESLSRTDGTGRCILTVRGRYSRYICKPFETMLEGRLGAMTALAAAAMLGDSRAGDAVKRYADELAKREELWTPGINRQELGLSEGTGGFLLGISFLYECGFVSRDFLESVEKRLKSTSLTPFPGCDEGLLYGIQGLNAGMARFQAALHPEAENGLPCLKMEFGHCRPDNYTIAFGAAGPLILAVARRKEKNAAAAEETEYFSRLMTARYPENLRQYPAPGFFFGEAGKLYALAFRQDPDAVPALFE